MSQKTVSTTEQNSLVGSIINSEFRIVKRLGGGSFGDIYLGVGIGGRKVAIKFEAHGTRCPQLRHEYKVYRELQGCDGIGGVSYYGVHETYNVMVMDLLGSSLEDLFVQCDRKFSLKTVLQLADQLLERIETMHNKHLVHRDVKPANFVLGIGPNSNTVYGIDFGLSSRYRHPKTLQHIPYREGRSLTGTPRFASINNHLGLEQSRRDDLESIGYVLIYFLKGSLPWQGLKARSARRKYKMIMDKKQSVSIQQLCDGLPPQFAEYISYCRGLKFDAKPNVLYLRGLFRELYISKGYSPNIKGQLEWDWSKNESLVSVISTEKPHVRSQTTPELPNSYIQQTALMVDFRPLEAASNTNIEATQRATVGTLPPPSLNVNDSKRDSTAEHRVPKTFQHKYTNSLPVAPLSPGRNMHRSAKSTLDGASKTGHDAADHRTRENCSSRLNQRPSIPNTQDSRHGFATMPGMPRRESYNSSVKRSKWYKWGSRLRPKYIKEYFRNYKHLDSRRSQQTSPKAHDSGVGTSREHDNHCLENSLNANESRIDGRTDHPVDNWNSQHGVLPLQTLPSIPTPGPISESPKQKDRWWLQDPNNVSDAAHKTQTKSDGAPTVRTPTNKRAHFKKLKFISRGSFSRATTSSNVVA